MHGNKANPQYINKYLNTKIINEIPQLKLMLTGKALSVCISV